MASYITVPQKSEMAMNARDTNICFRMHNMSDELVDVRLVYSKKANTYR